MPNRRNQDDQNHKIRTAKPTRTKTITRIMRLQDHPTAPFGLTLAGPAIAAMRRSWPARMHTRRISGRTACRERTLAQLDAGPGAPGRFRLAARADLAPLTCRAGCRESPAPNPARPAGPARPPNSCSGRPARGRMRSRCRRVTMLIQRRPGAVTGILCQRAPSRMSHRAPNRPCGLSASSRARSTAIRRRASSARAVCPAALPRMPKVRQDDVLWYCSPARQPPCRRRPAPADSAPGQARTR